jgi:hypothetical protein
MLIAHAIFGALILGMFLSMLASQPPRARRD